MASFTNRIKQSGYFMGSIGVCLAGIGYSGFFQKIYYDFLTSDCSIPFFQDIKRKKAYISNDSELRQEFEQNHLKYHNEKAMEFGFLFYEPYFVTDAYYEISQKYASKIIDATYSCYNMLLRTTDYVINENPEIMDFLNIPTELQPIIKTSWNQQQGKDLDLIGRFDFLVSENEQVKLLEFNGDTALLLIESGIGQQLFKKYYLKNGETSNLEQFNIIDQLLPKCWKNILNQSKPFSGVLSLMGHYEQVQEERATLEYLASTSNRSFLPLVMDIKDVKYENKQLTYQSNNLSTIWKLYPYEWMADEVKSLFEDFQNDFRKHYVFIEPPWKLVMSNKGLLPLMKRLYPECEYLLKSEFTLNALKQISKEPYVSKRFYGREGHSVLYSSDFESEEEFLKESYKPLINSDDHQVNIGGPIYQEFFQTPLYNGRGITIGSWIIQGVPAGFGIREDNKGKTDSQSSFVPHFIKDFNPQQTLFLTWTENLLRQKIYGQTHLSSMLKDEIINFRETVKQVHESPIQQKEIADIVQEGAKQRDHYVSTFWPIMRPIGGQAATSHGGAKRATRTLGKMFRSAGG